jgi:hypothetical protein
MDIKTQLSELIEARQEDVLQLFSEYGNEAKVNVDNVLLAYQKYGDSFLLKLYERINPTPISENAPVVNDGRSVFNRVSNFDQKVITYGNEYVADMIEKDKSSKWNNFKSLFEDGLSMLLNGWKSVKDTQNYVDTPPAETSAPIGINSAFSIGLIVIIGLVVLFVITKKK